MINRITLEDTVNRAFNISEKYKINVLSEKFKVNEKQIHEFTVKVLFVGGFSAGKSALINTFLGEDFLEEEQTPETAIATELIYSLKEEVILHKKEGQDIRISFSELNKYAPDDYFNYQYLINNDRLTRIEDYIIVDTPGFDSGIERHNKALLQYLDSGTAYILVVDCEKGTLSESAVNFINEINRYGSDIAVVINKCDKKPASDINDVQELISEILEDILDKNIKIITSSKYSEEAGANIENLISSFNAQSLFNRNVGQNVYDDLEELKSALVTINNSSDLNLNEYDAEIQKREKIRENLLNQVETEKRKLSNNLYGNVKTNILNDIKYSLFDNKDYLAEELKNGGEAFSQAINSILRPLLIELINKYSEQSFKEFAAGIKIDEINELANLEGMGDKFKIFTEKIGELSKLAEKAENINKIYKSVVAALAITTTFVAPWIELIIVFLPEIIKLLNVFASQSQDQQIKSTIENRVIPQIICKLESEIDKYLKELEEQMAASIVEKIDEIMSIETEALESIKNNKKNKENEFQDFINELLEDIKAIDEMKVGIDVN